MGRELPSLLPCPRYLGGVFGFHWKNSGEEKPSVRPKKMKRKEKRQANGRRKEKGFVGERNEPNWAWWLTGLNTLSRDGKKGNGRL